MIENPNVICNDCGYCKQNKELKERLKKTQELELEVRRENETLKELLKECRNHLITYKRDNINKGYVVYDSLYLIDKISQVLGEK